MNKKKYIILGTVIVCVMLLCIFAVIRNTFALPARFMGAPEPDTNCYRTYYNCSEDYVANDCASLSSTIHSYNIIDEHNADCSYYALDISQCDTFTRECCSPTTIDYSNCDDAQAKCTAKGGTLGSGSNDHICTVPGTVVVGAASCPSNEDLHCEVTTEPEEKPCPTVLEFDNCGDLSIAEKTNRCARESADYDPTIDACRYSGEWSVNGITGEEEVGFCPTVSCNLEPEQHVCDVNYSNCNSSDKKEYCDSIGGNFSNGVCSYDYSSDGNNHACNHTCESSDDPEPISPTKKTCKVTYNKCDTDVMKNLCDKKNGKLSGGVCTYQINENAVDVDCNTTYICKGDEPSSNPNTGSFLLYVVYLIGTLALGYTGYTIFKTRKNK